MTGEHILVVGGGFCGLSAAYDLTKQGCRVTLVEGDQEVGGLAGCFDAGGTRLEKFYHHWFTSDTHIVQLIEELGRGERVVFRPSNTGMYFANSIYRLSSPVDLLRFAPLPFLDRIRLGFLALRARRVGSWQELESVTAADWLRRLGGQRVYDVVWGPLLRGKFGDVAEEISAVWMWNKLKLRGSSRSSDGRERLAYYQGGFASLAEDLASAIEAADGSVRCGEAAETVEVSDGRVTGVTLASGETIACDRALLTPALPLVADMLEGQADPDYLAGLRRIRYLANLCVVLELDRSLSDTYWLNVNDPSFPFVAVIEHTNFEPSDTYAGRHIVYLSKYLPDSDPLYGQEDGAVLDFTLEHLTRMFPKFQRDWLLRSHVWRADYAQPVVERAYGSLIPKVKTPIEGLFLASMAQIYPEDRGTNYAVRQGRAAAAQMLAARAQTKTREPA
ncbi:MAG: NAD(P)/FAD-dependent oxidoreductase [Pseudomonadota bacterium]